MAGIFSSRPTNAINQTPLRSAGYGDRCPGLAAAES